MKKTIIIVSIIFSSLFVLLIFGFLFILSGAFAILYPDPPEPQIKYGEFPFKLTYELNGEILVIEDVVICEYDGIESLGTAGKQRKWTRKLKSGNERVVLLRENNAVETFEIYDGRWGLAEYYMGDFRQSKAAYERTMYNHNSFGCILWKDGTKTDYSITSEQAWEMYRLKVIDVQYSDPIENSFE